MRLLGQPHYKFDILTIVFIWECRNYSKIPMAEDVLKTTPSAQIKLINCTCMAHFVEVIEIRESLGWY